MDHLTSAKQLIKSFSPSSRRASQLSFSEKLNHPDGSAIKEALDIFIEREKAALETSGTATPPSAAECARRLHSWVKGCGASLKSHGPWKGESADEFQSSVAGMFLRITSGGYVVQAIRPDSHN